MIRLLLPVLVVAAAVIAWLLLAPALAERRLRRAGEHGLSEADACTSGSACLPMPRCRAACGANSNA
ncbi:MAG: hypothetical protein ACO3IZ_07295 [Steroidobacteraceae bacterium]